MYDWLEYAHFGGSYLNNFRSLRQRYFVRKRAFNYAMPGVQTGP